jgi:hypothetical protein
MELLPIFLLIFIVWFLFKNASGPRTYYMNVPPVVRKIANDERYRHKLHEYNENGEISFEAEIDGVEYHICNAAYKRNRNTMPS